MLRYPVHREIDQSMTLWGLEPDDLVVLAVIGYLVGGLTSRVHLRVGPLDATLLVSFGVVAGVFSLWHYYRRGKPRHYLRDLFGAVAEPDIWIVTPDLQARPPFRGE